MYRRRSRWTANLIQQSPVVSVFEQRTSQVSSEHKVKNEEAILVVLEGITEIHDEWVVNLESNVTSACAHGGLMVMCEL